MADLKLEIGKTYEDRKGRLHTIVGKSGGWMRDGIGRGYSEDGTIRAIGWDDWHLVRERAVGVDTSAEPKEGDHA